MNSRRRSSHRWIMGLGILMAAGTAAFFLTRQNGILPVSTLRLSTGAVEELLSATSTGTVEAERTAVIAAEIAGHVRRIHIRYGPAKAGTPIVEIDDTDLRAERLLTERNIETAQHRFEQAKLRREKLEADSLGQIAKDIAIARKDEHIAEAQLRELAASLAIIDLRIAKTRVLAPTDGIVAKLHTEEGQYVSPGQALLTTSQALFTFISGDILIRAPLDEVDLSRLPPKAQARVKFDGYPDKDFAADVVEVMPIASTDQKNNRTVDVKVKVRELPPNILPGMSARVEIIAGVVQNTRRLPTNVIHENYDAGTRYVYVFDNGVARIREVKTGRWNWNVTEILSGISDSDDVIETGKLPRDITLKDGMKISR